MITLRKSEERGHVDLGWLKSHHSFSFGSYYDPKHVAFRSLRVINEDYIAPGGGFPTHPHDNMEIVTYPLSGQLRHRDSIGNGSVILAGEVQRMSAGSGIQHSEFNDSQTTPVHLLQIWIHTNAQNIEPEYEQAAMPSEGRQNRLRPIVSDDGREGSLKFHQDAVIYDSELKDGQSLETHPAPNRHIWVQVIFGDLQVNGQTLHPGDAAALTDEKSVTLSAANHAHFLYFDLA